MRLDVRVAVLLEADPAAFLARVADLRTARLAVDGVALFLAADPVAFLARLADLRVVRLAVGLGRLEACFVACAPLFEARFTVDVALRRVGLPTDFVCFAADRAVFSTFARA